MHGKTSGFFVKSDGELGRGERKRAEWKTCEHLVGGVRSNESINSRQDITSCSCNGHGLERGSAWLDFMMPDVKRQYCTLSMSVNQ